LRSASRERKDISLRSSKRYCPLDHGTVNRCSLTIGKAPIAKLQSHSTVQVAFAWYFVKIENISKRCTFWSTRECRHIFSLIHMSMDDLCREDGQKVYDRKDCCLVSRQQKLRFLWYNFVFEQTTYEPPYMVSPDCLWRV